MSILIVDDEPSVRDFLKHWFLPEGYRVETPAEPLEALDKLHADRGRGKILSYRVAFKIEVMEKSGGMFPLNLQAPPGAHAQARVAERRRLAGRGDRPKAAAAAPS